MKERKPWEPSPESLVAVPSRRADRDNDDVRVGRAERRPPALAGGCLLVCAAFPVLKSHYYSFGGRGQPIIAGSAGRQRGEYCGCIEAEDLP
jgi:hypothetical protein